MSLVHRVEDLFKDKKYPERWQITTLNTVAAIQNGHAFKSALFNSTEGFPLLRIRDILESKIETYYSGDFSKEYIVNFDDLIIGMDGDFNHTLWRNKPSLLNQRVCRIKPNENFILKKFIFYGIGEFLKIINENTSSTTVKHLSSKSINEIPFPLPSLPEQQRIVAKLDALFAQHESMKKALESIPQLLKDFRQQVLTQAATGKLIPFINSENIKLNDLGIWKGGGTPSKGNSSFWNNGTILWITPKDMKELFLSNSIDKITKLAVQNSSAILIPKNSILIVTRSGILRRILPISSNSVETTVNQDLKVLIPNNKINYKFLLYILKGLEENIRTTCMKSGTTVESIEFSLLKDYKINIPMLLVQQEIVEKIDSLPQAILHKAFKGELVPQLPMDGDAKDLLDEIMKLKKEVKKK
ncbi:restriction endonuclease subunit S [Elizabethkingia anophelis]|uniref:restriction endonuclease subunit S n=1 Tax=Elizabethkingia anophelis TaxID=1117645 RepID=UPI003892A620